MTILSRLVLALSLPTIAQSSNHHGKWMKNPSGGVQDGMLL